MIKVKKDRGFLPKVYSLKELVKCIKGQAKTDNVNITQTNLREDGYWLDGYSLNLEDNSILKSSSLEKSVESFEQELESAMKDKDYRIFVTESDGYDGYKYNLNVKDSVYKVVVSNPKINIAPYVHFGKFLSTDPNKNSNYKFSGSTKIIPVHNNIKIPNHLNLTNFNQEKETNKEIVQKMKDISQKLLKQLEESELQQPLVIVNDSWKPQTRLEKFNKKLQQTSQKIATAVKTFFSRKNKGLK